MMGKTRQIVEDCPNPTQTSKAEIFVKIVSGKYLRKMLYLRCLTEFWRHLRIFIGSYFFTILDEWTYELKKTGPKSMPEVEGLIILFFL